MTQVPHTYDSHMDENLVGVWFTIRNEVMKDEKGIDHAVSCIESNRKTIHFLQTRIEANLKALTALESVKKS